MLTNLQICNKFALIDTQIHINDMFICVHITIFVFSLSMERTGRSELLVSRRTIWEPYQF